MLKAHRAAESLVERCLRAHPRGRGGERARSHFLCLRNAFVSSLERIVGSVRRGFTFWLTAFRLALHLLRLLPRRWSSPPSSPLEHTPRKPCEPWDTSLSGSPSPALQTATRMAAEVSAAASSSFWRTACFRRQKSPTQRGAALRVSGLFTRSYWRCATARLLRWGASPWRAQLVRLLPVGPRTTAASLHTHGRSWRQGQQARRAFLRDSSSSVVLGASLGVRTSLETEAVVLLFEIKSELLASGDSCIWSMSVSWYPHISLFHRGQHMCRGLLHLSVRFTCRASMPRMFTRVAVRTTAFTVRYIYYRMRSFTTSFKPQIGSPSPACAPSPRAPSLKAVRRVQHALLHHESGGRVT